MQGELYTQNAKKRIVNLRKKAELSSKTFTNPRKNQEVNLSVPLKIANITDCNVGYMRDFLLDYKIILIDEETG